MTQLFQLDSKLYIYVVCYLTILGVLEVKLTNSLILEGPLCASISHL